MDCLNIFQPFLLLGERTEFRRGAKLGAMLLPMVCALSGLRRCRPIRGDEVAAKMVQVSRQKGPPQEWLRLDEIFL